MHPHEINLNKEIVTNLVAEIARTNAEPKVLKGMMGALIEQATRQGKRDLLEK